MLLDTLRAWMKKSPSPAGRPMRRSRVFQPKLERLEERTLLSTGIPLEHLPSGMYVDSYQGVGFTHNQVAWLAASPTLNNSNTRIQINWGDNQTSWGELAEIDGPGWPYFWIKGSHVYQQPASGYHITVTIVSSPFGSSVPTETAEANVYAMPSGLPGTPPPNATPIEDPNTMVLQLHHLDSGVYVNTQVGSTTPVVVGSFSASLDGYPYQQDYPQTQFTAYVNWGNSSSWTKAQVVVWGPQPGQYDILATPTYAQPTTSGHTMPIVVYLTGPDGTSASMETAEANVAPGTLANTIKAELMLMLPTGPTPVVSQSGNEMTVKWGGWTISNDVSTAAPGAVGRESPGDVKTFVDMLQDAVTRSPDNGLLNSVFDLSHPMTFLVGSVLGTDNPGIPILFGSFQTNLVDVGQLGQLPQALPSNQGLTQGELIARLIAEKEYAANNPGASYNQARDLAGVPAENHYRQTQGETLMVETSDPVTPGTGFVYGETTLFQGGKEQVVQLNSSGHIQAGPVKTTPLPSNLPTVANALTHSAELYADFITHAYQKYLGRTPDVTGLASWVQAMQNGLSDEHLEAGLIGSAEYIANHGGPGAGWVIGMYQDLLGRTPSQAEVNAWVNALEHGVSTQQVAYGFAASAERESLRVQNDYLTFLGRSASPSEVSAWVNAFLHGYSNEDVVAGFVGSLERFQQAGNDIPTWIDNAYLSILGRHADSDAIDSWTAVLAQGLPST
jgi:hypothetical protein